MISFIEELTSLESSVALLLLLLVIVRFSNDFNSIEKLSSVMLIFLPIMPLV